MTYRKAWPGPLGELRSLWAIRRGGRFVGFAARWRSFWLAGLPDGYGTWETDPVTDTPVLYRTRQGVALRLAMLAEGIEP